MKASKHLCAEDARYTKRFIKALNYNRLKYDDKIEAIKILINRRIPSTF